jgi:hypothetical protein
VLADDRLGGRAPAVELYERYKQISEG